jgi:predicted O-methyltransferase YrrM
MNRYNRSAILLQKKDPEFEFLLDAHFHIYQEIQDNTRPVRGCGSYIHGGWSKDYEPQYFEKQRALSEACRDKSLILEVGVFDGSSLLIILMTNPSVRIVAVDICETADTRTAVDILNRYFGYRVVLMQGSSQTQLPQMLLSNPLPPFDMIHIDACHDFQPVLQDLCWVRPFLRNGTLLILDDVDNPGVQDAMRVFFGDEAGDMTTTTHMHNMGMKLFRPVQSVLPTVVTCLYDLGRPDQGCCMNVSKYLKLGNWFSSLPLPMVIFCEPKLERDLLDLRKGFGSITRVVPMPFDKTYYYKDIDVIRQRMTEHIIVNADPVKDTAETVALYNNKFAWLGEAMDTNPFGSTHFMWVDFGIGKNVKLPGQLVSLAHVIPDKICHCMLEPYFKPASTKEFFTQFYHHIAGSFFTGSIEYMQWYVGEFQRTWDFVLMQTMYQHDEAIMTMIVEDNPQMFKLYYGDYVSLFANYEYCFMLQDVVFRMVPRCLDRREYVKANAILDYLQSSCLYDKRFRYEFCRLCILSRYYRDKTLDPEVIAELTKPWSLALRQREARNIGFYGLK